jgi:hypothetical protein
MSKLPRKYIFIDESGDASFYSKNKNLLIGKSGFQPFTITEKTGLKNIKQVNLE